MTKFSPSFSVTAIYYGINDNFGKNRLRIQLKMANFILLSANDHHGHTNEHVVVKFVALASWTLTQGDKLWQKSAKTRSYLNIVLWPKILLNAVCGATNRWNQTPQSHPFSRRFRLIGGFYLNYSVIKKKKRDIIKKRHENQFDLNVAVVFITLF